MIRSRCWGRFKDSTYWIQYVDSCKYIASSSDGTKLVRLDMVESERCKWRLQDGGEGLTQSQVHHVDDEQSGQRYTDLHESGSSALAHCKEALHPRLKKKRTHTHTHTHTHAHTRTLSSLMRRLSTAYQNLPRTCQLFPH